MCPSLSSVGGFVNSIASGKVRSLQTFSAADVNHVWIRRRHGEGSHGTAGLVVENRVPGIPKVRGFPDSTIDRSHIKDVGLMRHARNGYGTSSSKGSNAAPPHLAEQLRIESCALLGKRLRFFCGMARKRRNRQNPAKDPCDCNCEVEPISPRETLTQTMHDPHLPEIGEDTPPDGWEQMSGVAAEERSGWEGAPTSSKTLR